MVEQVCAGLIYANAFPTGRIDALPVGDECVDFHVLCRRRELRRMVDELLRLAVRRVEENSVALCAFVA